MSVKPLSVELTLARVVLVTDFAPYLLAAFIGAVISFNAPRSITFSGAKTIDVIFSGV